MSVYTYIQACAKKGKKLLCVLIDPQELRGDLLTDFAKRLEQVDAVDFVFWGGSFVQQNNQDAQISLFKKHCSKPLVLFPGSAHQISDQADALLVLSVLNSRQTQYVVGELIGQAYNIKTSGIETISTGYILVNGGNQASVAYVSDTIPLPAHAHEIAVNTALAADILGMQMIYLEAGSGAVNAVENQMIKKVKAHVKLPLIVGGGLRSIDQIQEKYQSGADVVVIGNHTTESAEFLNQLGRLKKI